jgi:DNA-binding IclR family transcriptional regulator
MMNGRRSLLQTSCGAIQLADTPPEQVQTFYRGGDGRHNKTRQKPVVTAGAP